MAEAQFQLKYRGDYIAGAFRPPEDPTGQWEPRSPADLDDQFEAIPYAYAHVDQVVEAASKAFRSWRKTPQSERIAYLKKYEAVLRERQDEIAEAISREMGKPLWEAKTEAAAMAGKVSGTENFSLDLVKDIQIPKIMDGTDGAWSYRPIGVMAVIGPFNFPGHLANGHIVPALMTGNTVVFKPSEKTPYVGQLMAECMDQAGLPPGVFNLIQGEKEIGRRLCVQEGVSGILFTGSYEVGTRIKQDTLHQHWKILALEMGGKNNALVLEDADFDVALRESLIGSYITTGQRCSCTSRILLHESHVDRFVTEFHKRSKAFSIGHPLDNPFMGPLIDSTSVDRYLKFMGIAQREGCELIMRGKSLSTGRDGHYVTPAIALVKNHSPEEVKKSVYLQTEIFAPAVAIIPFREIEEAIDIANGTQYGLVNSVFSKNRESYLKVAEDLEVGLINWNRSTVGASGRLPFGGLKKSGNYFPAGVTATRYCTYQVASLEVASPSPAAPSAKTYPGLNWGS